MNIGLRRALHQLQRAGLDLRMAEDTFHRRFEAARPHLTNYYTRALVGELEAEDARAAATAAGGWHCWSWPPADAWGTSG